MWPFRRRPDETAALRAANAELRQTVRNLNRSLDRESAFVHWMRSRLSGIETKEDVRIALDEIARLRPPDDGGVQHALRS